MRFGTSPKATDKARAENYAASRCAGARTEKVLVRVQAQRSEAQQRRGAHGEQLRRGDLFGAESLDSSLAHASSGTQVRPR